MLVPFLPEQVVDQWSIIGTALSQALPPQVVDTPYVMNNILRSIMKEEAIVWGWQDEHDSDFYAFVLTTEVMDKVAGVKNYEIYAVTSLRPLAVSIWEEGIKTLKAMAKSLGCAHLTAMTSIPQLANFLEEHGWDTDFTFLKLKV